MIFYEIIALDNNEMILIEPSSVVENSLGQTVIRKKSDAVTVRVVTDRKMSRTDSKMTLPC